MRFYTAFTEEDASLFLAWKHGAPKTDLGALDAAPALEEAKGTESHAPGCRQLTVN